MGMPPGMTGMGMAMPVAAPSGTDAPNGTSGGQSGYGAPGYGTATGGADSGPYGQKAGGDDYGRERNSAGYHPYKR